MTLPLKLTFSANPASVAQAREAITGVCWSVGIDGDTRESVRLAVSEACTAAILYADGDRPFEMRSEICEDSLKVRVTREATGARLPFEHEMTLIRATASRATVRLTRDAVSIAMSFDQPVQRA